MARYDTDKAVCTRHAILAILLLEYEKNYKSI